MSTRPVIRPSSRKYFEDSMILSYFPQFLRKVVLTVQLSNARNYLGLFRPRCVDQTRNTLCKYFKYSMIYSYFPRFLKKKDDSASRAVQRFHRVKLDPRVISARVSYARRTSKYVSFRAIVRLRSRRNEFWLKV